MQSPQDQDRAYRAHENRPRGKEWLELVKDEVRSFVKGSFLENAEIIPVSSKTGDNLELLKERIRDVALTVEQKPVREIFRLP